MPKAKLTKKRTIKSPKKSGTVKKSAIRKAVRKSPPSRDASGGEDKKSARKYRRGSRVEAYTWGEVSGKKGSNWPF